jgi:CHAP domain
MKKSTLWTFWAVALTLIIGTALAHADVPKHVSIAASKVGTVETSNKNDGAFIERIVQMFSEFERAQYCAAFVSFCLDSASVVSPPYRGLQSRKFIDKTSIKARDVIRGVRIVEPGMLAVWRRGEDAARGHVGIVESWADAEGEVIEGNTTSPRGEKERRQGVWRKTRRILTTGDFRITHFTPVIYQQ